MSGHCLSIGCKTLRQFLSGSKTSGSKCAPTRSRKRNFYLTIIHIKHKGLFLMPTETQRLDDLHAIRTYITETLCEKDRLEKNSFPLYERILVRDGAPCGVYFC